MMIVIIQSLTWQAQLVFSSGKEGDAIVIPLLYIILLKVTYVLHYNPHKTCNL